MLSLRKNWNGPGNCQEAMKSDGVYDNLASLRTAKSSEDSNSDKECCEVIANENAEEKVNLGIIDI